MITVDAQINMIKQQLRTGDVTDEKILDLYEKIYRHQFVPTNFSSFAYSDMQIPLAHDQCMMTPLEEAKLLQSLMIKSQEKVLEIGTGTGFLTALLSKLADKVITVDYFADFTQQAKDKLIAHACTNVELITGDASHGWIENAPYDVIIFTGSLPKMTDEIRMQVLPRGRLFALIGKAPVMQGQLHYLQQNQQWSMTCLFETNIPMLIDKLEHKKFKF